MYSSWMAGGHCKGMVTIGQSKSYSKIIGSLERIQCCECKIKDQTECHPTFQAVAVVEIKITTIMTITNIWM